MCETKRCSTCKEVKPFKDFYKGNGKYGLHNSCKPCNNAICVKHIRTFEGRIKKAYRDIKVRVNDPRAQSHDYYKNFEVVDKEAFVEFSKNDKDYQRLHAEWVESGYNKDITPSIDRIDTSKGYILGNMRWITWRDNILKIK